MKKIICNGDSWVFGCEIVNPEISKRYNKNVHPGEYDYLEENDNYRIEKIFPTRLGKLLNADVVNLSWPADDNGTILNRTISYITKKYISNNIPTDDILVIIGWSSPERNFFWYKDEDFSSRFRLWPQVKHFDRKPQEEIWNLYVTYLWNEEEYIPRYVMDVLQFQNFCDTNNIKWVCFNSFYQTPNENITEWNDLNFKKELIDLNNKNKLHGYSLNKNMERKSINYDYLSIWDTINPVRFYKKNEDKNTFKSFIESKKIEPVFNGWHPSPTSHEIWARELFNYINENKLF
jgi:hypothetical protein